MGRQLPPGDDYAESWEVCDRGEDQCIVAAGPLTGVSLSDLAVQHGAELFGRHRLLKQFPLLFKLLDAHRPLSVQVHPNDRQAAQSTPPDRGKTEAWVVLHAEPGSVIYAGLKRGFDRAAFERELHRGTGELCLHKFQPKIGDCVFIPAGAVHALGAGLMIAEIQQSSDRTFRLYDWNRLDANSQPRPLHIEQGLGVIDFDLGPIEPVLPQPTERPGIERLVECDHFVLERWRLKGTEALPVDDRCRILFVVQGAVAIEGDPTERPLARGETALTPAAIGGRKLQASGPAEILSMHLP